MTDQQLYFAVGIPSLLALVNLAVILTLFTTLGGGIERVAERLDNMTSSLTGAINELDKRLSRVEIKLGIQP
jgi:hypothetical protein